MFPQKLILGIEIREKVVEYVSQKILEHRKGMNEFNEPDAFNIAVLRTNAMKFLPNLFEKGQLLKMFFLYPDPHFKKTNHRRRIIRLNILFSSRQNNIIKLTESNKVLNYLQNTHMF